jgi:ATP-dependent DNA helicase RecG
MGVQFPPRAHGVADDGTTRKVIGLERAQTVESNLISKIAGKMNLDVTPRLEFINIGGHTCLVVHCPKGEAPPYQADGTTYIRKGSNNIPANEDEIASLYRDRSSQPYDRTPIKDATMADLDLGAASVYLAQKTPLEGGSDLENLMRKVGLLKDVDGVSHPTIAGLLLFGKNPQQFLPNARIKAEVKFDDASTDWDDIADIGGTIFDQIRDFEQFLKRNMRSSAEVIGFERVERPQFPLEALREAIVNAVVHRDYSKIGSEVVVRWKDDQITFDNPGGLVAPLTIKDILSEQFLPKTRNVVTATVLTEAGLMDKRGSGFVRMQRRMSDFDLETPEFTELPDGFRVSFKNKRTKPLAPGIIIPQRDLDKADLNTDHKRILRLLETKKTIRASEAASVLKISKGTVLVRLKYLLAAGIIERTSGEINDPNTGYRLHRRYLAAPISNKISTDSPPGTLF